MMKKFTIFVGMFALLSVGACKSGGSEKDDEKATDTKEQKQTEEKKEGDKKGEEHPGDEHPGDEAEGDEHAGEEHAGEEHAGEEHAGEDAKKSKKGVSGKDIKKAMKSHIDKRTKEGDGVFKIDDEKSGNTLKLKFVKIHDPVRKIEGKGYFACTDFHVKGKKKKVYDLDFWLKKKDGELKVTKEKIHKHPVKKDGEWQKEARYTFKDDEVVKVD